MLCLSSYLDHMHDFGFYSQFRHFQIVLSTFSFGHLIIQLVFQGVPLVRFHSYFNIFAQNRWTCLKSRENSVLVIRSAVAVLSKRPFHIRVVVCSSPAAATILCL